VSLWGGACHCGGQGCHCEGKGGLHSGVVTLMLDSLAVQFLKGLGKGFTEGPHAEARAAQDPQGGTTPYLLFPAFPYLLTLRRCPSFSWTAC